MVRYSWIPYSVDDIVLISLNIQGPQLMLNISSQWASNNSIMFSTDPIPTRSKTKAMRITGTNKDRGSPSPLILDGQELPYVYTLLHLRHMCSKDGIMLNDTWNKWMIYLAKVNEIKEGYGFLEPWKL